ncbi:unnamed protein product [Moneuplotes crassus]|uniref:NAD(P)-binding domain-containing protein n=1 Tax=Euplotes crassus TaxID=5936 RepID=A0AAD1XW98_EUPCR|nr:unnamed protein product [Moneuplotes crassus]
MESEKTYTAAVIGGTGAIGKRLIELLLKDDRCQKIVTVARNPLPDWEGQEKLKVVQMDNMDNMAEASEEFEGCQKFYCCLGTRVKVGKELFVKVDKTYPIEFAKICAMEEKADRYTLVSSGRASSKSWLLYFRTKGECEEELSKMGLQGLTIMKPGLLTKRDADFRLGEKLGSYVPFIPKIDCIDVARAMIENSLESTETLEVLENKDLHNWAEKSKL